MLKKYPLFDIYWDEDDIEKILSVIKRGSFWATGPEIQEFELELRNYFDVKNVITFNSGTSALHAALLAYGLTSGEIIVPSMTFISTANCVILAGAKPIFADIETETIGLDANDVNEKITKNTRAIIPVHFGGRVCKNINALKEIAEDKDLILIEDNAESFGAKIDENLAGTIGNAGMLSFCQNKIITTGEGGAICTNDDKIAQKLLLIRSHGRVEQLGENYFSNINEMEYIQIGYNFRMPSMNAALGIAQLRKINRIIKIRREKGLYYDKILKNNQNVEIMPDLKNNYNVYQLYNILLKDYEKKNELQKYLLEKNIFTKVYFHPIHLKQFYKEKFNYKEGDFPITEEISKKILTLPISLRFKKEDQDYIIEMVNSFFKSI
ncbi:MAG: DegT/DnrJ/EryC1/StrS family aminotransferase [Promethearchaeota archaeon]